MLWGYAMGYCSIFFLPEFGLKAISCTIKAQIVTTGQHQNILGQSVAFGTGLRVHYVKLYY